MPFLVEIVVALVYLAVGFRYSFSLTYPTIIRQELAKEEKAFNNNIGRWEKVKIRTSPEGTWTDVIRAAGWSLLWMWVWPAFFLVRGGGSAAEHVATKYNAHKVATTLTMTKRNPHIKRIDSELRKIHIAQIEKEVGIGQDSEN